MRETNVMKDFSSQDCPFMKTQFLISPTLHICCFMLLHELKVMRLYVFDSILLPICCCLNSYYLLVLVPFLDILSLVYCLSYVSLCMSYNTLFFFYSFIFKKEYVITYTTLNKIILHS